MPIKSKKTQSPLGGVAAVAEMLAHMDAGSREKLLANVAKEDFKLASAIEDKLFTFEDLARLDDKSLQTLLREIPQPLLALALRKASDELKTAIIRNLSERAGKILLEEMTAQKPQKLTDVLAAQEKIIAKAKAFLKSRE